MIINLILISIITTYIIEVSGVVEELKRMFWKWLVPVLPYRHINIKPFDCAICMTFWVGLVYIIVSGVTLPYLALVCLNSLLVPIMANIMIGVREMLIRITNKIK